MGLNPLSSSVQVFNYSPYALFKAQNKPFLLGDEFIEFKKQATGPSLLCVLDASTKIHFSVYLCFYSHMITVNVLHLAVYSF